MESLLRNRRGKLGIRDVTFDCEVHPWLDNGVYQRASGFLRPFLKSHENAFRVARLNKTPGEVRSLLVYHCFLAEGQTKRSNSF